MQEAGQDAPKGVKACTLMYQNLARFCVFWSPALAEAASAEKSRLQAAKGGVAQMVERSLCMREVPGSIPGVSIPFAHAHLLFVGRPLRA